MVDKIVNLPQPELSLKDALIKSLQGSEEAQTDHFNEVYARLLRPGVPAKAKLDCAHQQGFTCCGPGGGPSIK